MNLEDVGQFGKWIFNIPPGPLHMELQLQTNNRVDVVWVGDAVPDISVKILFHDGCLTYCSSCYCWLSHVDLISPLPSDIVDGEPIVEEDHLGRVHRHQRLVRHKDKMVGGFRPAAHLGWGATFFFNRDVIISVQLLAVYLNISITQ